MNSARLLAKSTKSPDKPRRGESLPGHAAEVCLAAETLLKVCGATALERAGFDGPDAGRWFFAIVRAGAFLHDLGKANAHFQAMVRNPKEVRQLIRHEALSAILAFDHPDLHRWLRTAPWCQGEDSWILEAAAFAAAGHHLKFHDDVREKGATRGPLRVEGAGGHVVIHLGHPDFHATLQLGQKIGLSDPPKLADLKWRSCDPLDEPDEELQGALFDPKRGLLSRQGRGAAWWRAQSPLQRRVFALAKAWVVAADVLGSALPKEHLPIAKWVADALGFQPSAEQLDEVVRERLKGKALRPFQRSIAASTSRVTLVEAGCGTGKTIAAYAWAAERGRRGEGGKLFFAYPTTGTATEGFRGYVARADSVEATLVHGRASVDLEDLLATGDADEQEQSLRNESLDHLRSQVIVCTVDTVLGLVQNQRRGLFLSSAIATGRHVFDEVHAYDDRMFAALLDFLAAFPRAPVLLMSASIPAGRRAAIERVAGAMAPVERPADVEGVPRYRVRPVSSEEEVWALVNDHLNRHKRVLWVANTVARAIAVAKRADGDRKPVRCYHSRYCYVHRKDRHREVVDAFEPDGPAVLAVTTQVAEMSLDLSADLLVTELAPPPALVQRLGRLNRRASPEAPGTPGTAVAIKPPSPLPYSPTDLEAGERFWREASGINRPLDQRDLNVLMHAALGDTPWPPTGDAAAPSAWLEGGPVARGGKLRESEASVSVILEEYVPLIVAAAQEGAGALHAALIRYEVPIPAKPAVWEWRTLDCAPFHHVAPASAVSYDPRWGAAWRKLDEEENGD